MALRIPARISKMLLHPTVCEDSDCVHRQEGETKKEMPDSFKWRCALFFASHGVWELRP